MKKSESQRSKVPDIAQLQNVNEFEIEEYKAILTVQEVGKVNISWFNPDGSSRKNTPSVIKNKHSKKLADITEKARQIEISLVAQRDRIDRMFRAPAEMSWEYFKKHFHTNGLESYATQNLIWKFNKDGEVNAGIFLRGRWITHQGSEIQPDQAMKVSLWHPALESAEDVLAWRKIILENEVCQPINQAFREVYRLREVEAEFVGCSDRIGIHFLKQHPFNSFAKSRGWKYSMMGMDDEGDDFGASLDFKEHNLRAQFWVFEVNEKDYFDEDCYWNYIVTHLVRFIDAKTKKPVDLSSVPPVIFSEVIRDGDLFVSATSIGNDTIWKGRSKSDELRDYFNSYSFGALTEIAKTRREVLEKVLPKLRIAGVATLHDNYLIIKGKRRTYKIHIGSTKVLMEPGDQYLSINSDRLKTDSSDKIVLPFEGDPALPVILNKAFFLADDDTIADSKILKQISS